MKIKTLLIALAIFFVSNTVAFAGKPIKWHPGHYMMLVGNGKTSDFYMNQVWQEIDSHSALRGIAIRYPWAELEPTKGAYNFANIDKHLATLKSKGKYLIILIEGKSFKPKEYDVPAYLRTAEYEGGVFPHGKNGVVKGWTPKLWNAKVYARYAALIAALGKHLDGHPNFEGIGLQETATGTPIKPLTSLQTKDYYNNVLRLNVDMGTSFPNTMSYQLANYPRSFLPNLVNTLKTTGGTLGATDIFLTEADLFTPGTKYVAQGLYLHFPQLNGSMPLLAQVEGSNYANTKHDGSGYKPTVQEILTFGRDKLFANYILWTRDPIYWDKVLEVMSQKAQKVNPSGGLIAKCPTDFICIQ